MNLANITRLHNIVSAVGGMRRTLALVEDYSYKRKAFGKLIKDQDLHILTFSQLKYLYEGNLILMLELGKLQGRSEGSDNYKHNHLLRLLLPLSKLFTAKCVIEVASEGMECFGGVGYMENSGIPIGLRDASVLSIWEGTTNVLSLDFLRVINHHKDVIKNFFTQVKKNLLKAEDYLNEKDRGKTLYSIISHLESNEKLFFEIQTSRSLSFL